MPLQPSQPQSQINTSIEQQQANNFLGPVRGALGGLPVAERNQSYFIVFQQAGGTGPEIIDQTAYFITYLVDENGNVSKPSSEYDSLHNLVQNFPTGQNAIVRNDASTALNGSLTGIHPISAIGRQQPILYTQTGSTPNANVSTLLFNSSVNQSEIPRMEGSMTKGHFNPTLTTWTTVNPYNSPTSDPDVAAASFDNIAGTYTVTTAGIGDTSTVFFRVTAGFRNDSGTHPYNVSLRIKRDTTVIATKQYTIPVNNSDPFLGATGGGYLNTSTDPITIGQLSGVMVGDPVYTVEVQFENAGVTYADFTQLSIINQNPEPSAPPATGNFWLNNSGNHLWVTASAELSTNYGRIPSPTQECLDFNFSPIETPFKVVSGDRIRFEYNPNTEYWVYEVIEPSSDIDGRLKLRLNTLVDPSIVNLNNFVLHNTNVNDPAYIILDVKKNASVGDTQNFNGVILPEYPTKKLKDNLEDIIIGLKQSGIITDNEN